MLRILKLLWLAIVKIKINLKLEYLISSFAYDVVVFFLQWGNTKYVLHY